MRNMVDNKSAKTKLLDGAIQRGRPPGPKGVPLLGNLPEFGRDKLGFFTRCAREHGDITAFKFAAWPCLLLCDSDDIENVLVRNHSNFIKHRVVLRHVTAVFGNGLLTSEGDQWQRQRRLSSPAFSGQQLLGYGSDIVDLTRRMLTDWKSGDVRDIHSEMMGLTLRVAAKTLFDSDVEQDIADMERAVNDMTVEIERRLKRPFVLPDWLPLPGHWRYRNGIRTGERIIHQMIAERHANGTTGRNDFLSRLMATRDGTGRSMTDGQLRDQALTLLLAGHETTALALSWTWYLLAQNPEIDARVAVEIAKCVGDRPVSVEDLPALKLTEATVLEAMRLYPPAWVMGRESIDAFELRGYRFDGGTTVFVSPWVQHRDPRHFDEPEHFLPDRWLGDLPRKLPRYSYMPFGGGPRICIGQRFAMIEAVMVLATIVQHFSIMLEPVRAIEPFPSITLRPKGGVHARLLRRAPAASSVM